VENKHLENFTIAYIYIYIYIYMDKSGTTTTIRSNFRDFPGKYLLNFKAPNKQVLFNWSAFYKPNSLPSSTLGSSSGPGLIGARKRRT
tara:strand:+ start:1339 stop:1602 length:264 start_codon:yes stop_codon:yes gene_type:complete